MLDYNKLIEDWKGVFLFKDDWYKVDILPYWKASCDEIKTVDISQPTLEQMAYNRWIYKWTFFIYETYWDWRHDVCKEVVDFELEE